MASAVNDAELIDRTLAGDAAAPAELVRRHARRIRALCWSRLPAHGPVEDMVQETFLRGFRLLAQLDRRESLGSFLAGIAVRVCSDWRRARARSETPLDAPESLPADDAPSQSVRSASDSDPEMDDRLARAVRGLPEAYRDAIALFYFADRSYREIAAALG